MAREGEGGKWREPLVGGLSGGTDRKRVSRDMSPPSGDRMGLFLLLYISG